MFKCCIYQFINMNILCRLIYVGKIICFNPVFINALLIKSYTVNSLLMKNKKSIFTIRPQGSILNAKKGKSIHQSLKWVLVIAQCFGQMPVTGVTNRDPKYLKFSWKSWRFFYCIIYCTCIVLINLVLMQIILTKGLNFFLSSKYRL